MVIAIFSLIGAAICLYIRHSKKSNVPMVCPIGGHCFDVVTGPYSRLFGIGNETMGLFYYLGLIAVSAAVWLYPSLLATGVSAAVLFSMAAAFMMSVLLFFLQIVVIRRTCSWCLMTAVINSVLLLAGLAKF